MTTSLLYTLPTEIWQLIAYHSALRTCFYLSLTCRFMLRTLGSQYFDQVKQSHEGLQMNLYRALYRERSLSGHIWCETCARFHRMRSIAEYENLDWSGMCPEDSHAISLGGFRISWRLMQLLALDRGFSMKDLVGSILKNSGNSSPHSESDGTFNAKLIDNRLLVKLETKVSRPTYSHWKEWKIESSSQRPYPSTSFIKYKKELSDPLNSDWPGKWFIPRFCWHINSGRTENYGREPAEPVWDLRLIDQFYNDMTPNERKTFSFRAGKFRCHYCPTEFEFEFSGPEDEKNMYTFCLTRWFDLGTSIAGFPPAFQALRDGHVTWYPVFRPRKHQRRAQPWGYKLSISSRYEGGTLQAFTELPGWDWYSWRGQKVEVGHECESWHKRDQYGKRLWESCTHVSVPERYWTGMQQKILEDIMDKVCGGPVIGPVSKGGVSYGQEQRVFWFNCIREGTKSG